jgi:hypothetical protein
VLFSIAELHLSKSKVVHHFDAKLGEQSGGAIRAASFNQDKKGSVVDDGSIS